MADNGGAAGRLSSPTAGGAVADERQPAVSSGAAPSRTTSSFSFPKSRRRLHPSSARSACKKLAKLPSAEKEQQMFMSELSSEGFLGASGRRERLQRHCRPVPPFFPSQPAGENVSCAQPAARLSDCGGFYLTERRVTFAA